MRARSVATIIMLTVSVIGCGDPVVGGECAAGFDYVAGEGCVSVATTTGDATPTSTDAAALEHPDAADGQVPTDASTSESSAGDGSAACANGTVSCGNACIDVSADPANCGGCGIICEGTALCAHGECVTTCPAATVACDGRCVSVDSDPNNCGACGRVCSTGVCNAGICRDARAGHIVLIGHGYQQSRPDQDRLIANAVFLAPSSPARVLALETWADTTSGGVVDRIDGAITDQSNGRRWSKTIVLEPSEVPGQLSVDRFDAILVYPQPLAKDNQIALAASTLGSALASFARAGGVVIVIDGVSTNSGNYPFVNATSMLAIRGETPTDPVTAQLVAPADAIAVGVATEYRTQQVSVTYDVDAADAVFSTGAGPVVLHRAVLP